MGGIVLFPPHLVLLFGGRVDFRRENFIDMLTMVIGWMGILLAVLLLVRGLQENLVHRFPVFYFYILFVVADDLLRYYIRVWHSKHYFNVYWATQFICIVIGSAVLFEVYRVALRSFPGTARMARYVLLLIFGAVFAKALSHPLGGVYGWLAETSEELERNLRMVQAVAILALVALFLWYAIPFGKNLRGILLGYGLFVGLSIVQF